MSIFWPDVQEEAGRRSAVSRGFWGGVVITLLTALGPPPMGAVSLVTFGLITAGIGLRQTWAARAGVLAAYSPLLLTAQQPDRTLLFGAFFQCTILAYFFFSAWRGLRVQTSLLHRTVGVLWLALSLAYSVAWYYASGAQRVPDDHLKDDLIAGDTVLVRPAETAPQPGDIVVLQPEKPTDPVHFERVDASSPLDPKKILGVVRWRLWSDGAQPTDAPLAYYTKARWHRFPKEMR